MATNLTLEDLQAHMKQSRIDARNCVGSSCLDEAAKYTSLMSYVRIKAIEAKQRAYVINVTEMNKGESAAKSEAIMKASDDYKEHLLFQGYADDMLEQVRNMRAKGKGDDSERVVS